MKKIIHIITGLNNGGAEMMLYKLLKYSDNSKYIFEVISLMDEGIMGSRIMELGIKVHTLNMKRGIPNPKCIIKALKLTKDCDAIQTWMYHADFFGYILTCINRKKLIWGIRHSNLIKGVDKKSTYYLAKINGVLSKKPNNIIINSESALKYHKSIGYNTDNMVVIPNGFETERFYKRLNNYYREKFNINNGEMVLLKVARWHPMKGDDILLSAVQKLKKEGYSFKLLLCGTDMNNKNKRLLKMILDLKLQDIILLLGQRDDIPELMSMSDIYISSSISGEGFPNVIGEAMASELPCIVTDVGDSRYIIGDYGKVVAPFQSSELYSAIKKVIDMSEVERITLGKQGRIRVLDLFKIEIIAKKYERIYSKLL